MLFLNKSIYNLILQLIRSFKFEFDYEMKFKHTVLRTPASQLKFRITDREGWRNPIRFSSLTMTEFEHIIWLERIACNTEILSSDNKYQLWKIFWELNLVEDRNHEKYRDNNNSWRLFKIAANMLSKFTFQVFKLIRKNNA